MKKKISYRSVSVNHLAHEPLLKAFEGHTALIMGVDVSKVRLNIAVVTNDGAICAQFHCQQPSQLPLLFALCDEFTKRNIKLSFALEPTGVYGDVFREQATQRGFQVLRVSPKKVKDSKEIFDDVPSQHDAKDAVVIAKLAAQRLASPWLPMSSWRAKAKALMAMRELHVEPMRQNLGRLEAIVQRHFPELNALLDVQQSTQVLELLQQYPSPALMSEHPESVSKTLHRGVRADTKESVVQAANNSVGVAMAPDTQMYVQAMVEDILIRKKKVKQVDEQISAFVNQQPELETLVQMVGPQTTCVILAEVGNPKDFGSAQAFQKACGLNLKEGSSGDYKSKLSISKRGSPLVRKYLHFLSLRKVKHDAIVRAWYEKRRAFVRGQRMSAVMAVTRKLARAIWWVAKGEAFDARRLFDVQRLNLGTVSQESTKVEAPSESLSPQVVAPLEAAPASQAGIKKVAKTKPDGKPKRPSLPANSASSKQARGAAQTPDH